MATPDVDSGFVSDRLYADQLYERVVHWARRVLADDGTNMKHALFLVDVWHDLDVHVREHNVVPTAWRFALSEDTAVQCSYRLYDELGCHVALCSSLAHQAHPHAHQLVML